MGIEVIMEDPKNVRYKMDDDGEGDYNQWQYRTGNDTIKWRKECAHRDCMGMGAIPKDEIANFFEKLYGAVRAPKGSVEADLAEVFDLLEPCGYGHPLECGEAQFAEARKACILAKLVKKCKYGDKCVNGDGACSMFHNALERAALKSRLEAHVEAVCKKMNPGELSWGSSSGPLVIGSKSPVPSNSNWKSPVLPAESSVKNPTFSSMLATGSVVASMFVKSKPITVSNVTMPPALIPSAVVQTKTIIKSQADDDTIDVDVVHSKYVNDLKARVMRHKADITTLTKEITDMNKAVEMKRAKMAHLEVDNANTLRLISNMTVGLSSESESPLAPKKAEVSLVRQPHTQKAEVKSKDASPPAVAVKKAASKLKSDEAKSSPKPKKVVEAKDASESKSSVSIKKAVQQISTPQSMPILSSSSDPSSSDTNVDVSLDGVDPDLAELAGPMLILPQVNPEVVV
jgi:hypothetical protein